MQTYTITLLISLNSLSVKLLLPYHSGSGITVQWRQLTVQFASVVIPGSLDLVSPFEPLE